MSIASFFSHHKISLRIILSSFFLYSALPVVAQGPGFENELEVELAYQTLARTTKAFKTGSKEAIKSALEHPVRTACGVALSLVIGALPVQCSKAVQTILVGALVAEIVTNKQLQEELSNKSMDEGFEILVAHGGYLLTNLALYQTLGTVASVGYRSSISRLAPFLKDAIPQGTFTAGPVNGYTLGAQVKNGDITVGVARLIDEESIRVVGLQWAKSGHKRFFSARVHKADFAKGNIQTSELPVDLPFFKATPEITSEIPSSANIFRTAFSTTIPPRKSYPSASSARDVNPSFTPEQKENYKTALEMLREHDQSLINKARRNLARRPPQPDLRFNGYRHYLGSEDIKQLNTLPINEANVQLADEIFSSIPEDTIFYGIGDRYTLRECILKNTFDLTKIESSLKDLITPEYLMSDSDSSLKRLLISGFSDNKGALESARDCGMQNCFCRCRKICSVVTFFKILIFCRSIALTVRARLPFLPIQFTVFSLFLKRDVYRFAYPQQNLRN